MTRRCLAALLCALLATTAAAQTVALDVFLEQRVAEELAADGTLLSRLGVTLDVELVGDKALVSLVDPATNRALASTKIDTLPANREAAVATVTQVVANLAAQLATTTSATSATTADPATAMKAVLEEERLHRARAAQTEASYEREAIRFKDRTLISSTGETTTTHLTMVPYRGGRRLSMPEFFDAIERPDLSSRFYRRRNFGVGAVAVGLVASAGGLFVAYYKGRFSPELGACSLTKPGYADCQAAEDKRNAAGERDADRWIAIGLGIAAGGLVATWIGCNYAGRANPVDEREAHDLADAHNAKLRIKHGLPAISQRSKPRLEEVRLAPYADVDGGGLAVTGRF